MNHRFLQGRTSFVQRTLTSPHCERWGDNIAFTKIAASQIVLALISASLLSILPLLLLCATDENNMQKKQH